MRALALVLLCFQTLAASAQQIDLAVIRFPEPKTVEEMNAALQGTRLAELSNSDRTVSSNPVLKGGTVLFARTSPIAGIISSTRLGAQRAEVDGSYRSGRLDIRIVLSEGFQTGLRSFSSRTYQGSVPLAPGSPRVVSLRTITGKTQSVLKGDPSVRETSACHAILAQIR